MTIYAGLDVSDKQTHVCVINAEGKVIRRDCVASDPEALSKWLKRHCAGVARVVLETGPLSTFLGNSGATIRNCAKEKAGSRLKAGKTWGVERCARRGVGAWLPL